MIKVLHISPSINVKGGISALLQYFITTDLPNCYELHFVASHKDGSKIYKYYVAITGMLRMVYLMIWGKIDIVHIHCGDITSSHRKFLYFKIAQLFKKKIVLHLHGALFIEQFNKSSTFWRKRLSVFFEESHVVICLAKSWSHDIGLLFPRSKRLVIPNGIPLPQIDCLQRDHKEVIVTFLGLIGPRKGIFDLLLVVKDLVAQGLPIFLKIGGNGEVDRLKKNIQEAALQDHVEYLGWVTPLERKLLLEKTDIYVLPSYGEGMPMSILEAMSYSIPIVSTMVGGIPELVRNDYSGFLVCPGDTAQLSSKLKLLVENKKLRSDMGKHARESVEQYHDIELVVERIGKVYDNLFSHGGYQ
ncbi:MAG: glycosyltransferase family 4 protein [Chlorobium sp.]|nr:glycosyltransferase family 4 protein [Chlorobium sp.]